MLHATTLLITAAVLGGCSLLPGARGDVPAELRGDWGLVEGRPDDLAPLDDHPVTLTLEADRLGGTAACNSYGAPVSWDGRAWRLEEGVSSTAMGCEPEVQALEQAFLGAVAEVRHVGLDGDHLVVSGDDFELRFEPLAGPDVEALTDRDWVATAVIRSGTRTEVADLPAPITLRLDADGRLRGSTGCRQLTGRWEASQDRVIVPELRADGECGADGRHLDDVVVAVVGDGFRPAVEDDRLTITDPGGDAIEYVVAAG